MIMPTVGERMLIGVGATWLFVVWRAAGKTGKCCRIKREKL